MPGRRRTSHHNVCTLCLETLQLPRMLPCVHSFCLECLEDLIQSLARNNTFECPNCRKSIPIPPEGARGFPPNIYVGECDVPSEDSDDCDGNQQEQYDKCKSHTRKFVKFYCRPCETPICRDCKLTSHEGHQTCDFAHEISRVRTLVDDVKSALEDVVLPRMYQAIDDAETDKHNLADDRRRIREEIKQKGETLKQLIDKCVQEKLHSCDQRFKTSNKPFVEMNKRLNQLQALIDSMNASAREGSQTGVISLEKRLKDFFLDNARSRPLSADLKKTLSQTPFSLSKLRVFDTARSTTPRLELAPAEHVTSPIRPTSAAVGPLAFPQLGTFPPSSLRQASSEETALLALEVSVNAYIGDVRDLSESAAPQTSVNPRAATSVYAGGRGADRRSEYEGRITSYAAFDRMPSNSVNGDLPGYDATTP